MRRSFPVMILPTLVLLLSTCGYPYWCGDYCYIVTFNSNLAEVPAVPSEKSVENPARKIDALPVPPQKAGDTFCGWWTKPQAAIGGEPFTADTLVKSDMTVYAHWEPNYRVGETGQAGGIVFYAGNNYANGWRYMEVTPGDLSEGIQWWNGSVVAISTQYDVGSGKANTEAIIAAQGEGSYAAKLCQDYSSGGYDDWFLPSELEWANIRNKLSADFFTSTGYWTSTQNGLPGDTAWAWRFDERVFRSTLTSELRYVRAIRMY